MAAATSAATFGLAQGANLGPGGFQLTGNAYVDQLILTSGVNAVVGGTAAEIQGGDFWRGAGNSAMYAAGGFVVGNALAGALGDSGGASNADRKTVELSIDNAKDLVDDAIVKLERWNTNDQTEYQKLFGDPVNRNKVLDGFRAIRKALDGPITWNKTNNPYYASVIPGGRVHIELARDFWTAPALGVNSQAGTMIHEISHEVWRTNDHVYGTAGAKNLAQTHPSRAINNADNYEYFSEVIP